MMSSVLRACRPAASLAPRGAFQQQRSLWAKVPENMEADRIASRMQTILAEDGTLKTLALKRFHEKKWQKRKRKAEEQNIRRANRRVGSMIDFILRRKKSCVNHAAGGCGAAANDLFVCLQGPLSWRSGSRELQTREDRNRRNIVNAASGGCD
ncbi:unnamed protein product [Phytophthora lilii]|uniref:Unnamed protein product n=1 Tax=Phytophthora lilii TaxID=2077276 RepID=A0A9W6WRI8_9STRA|nr:unnamed protein product [Phytophthora lilii]